MPQQYLSPIEAGYAQGYGQPGYAASPPGAYQQAVARQPRIYRAPSSGGSTAGRASGPRVVKHTKRDAAIGAVAGAAIGAVTSGKRDRLKGAVIGAAAGAILGGVIGNNVDLSRIPR
ncbi:MAG: glycine zipper 2TM domain-containing protein [Gemmatimonadaceae bacterium]|nr:glycine zipper 2TM domain-containing protein [Gemmatimonadaceae bacterium]